MKLKITKTLFRVFDILKSVCFQLLTCLQYESSIYCFTETPVLRLVRDKEMCIFEQLTTKIFPEAVNVGNFGPDVSKFVRFDVQNQKAIDQFGSGVIFGDVVLKKSAGDDIKQSVVIKRHRLPDTWGVDASLLFHNEVLFYEKIIPSLQKYDKDGFLNTCFPEFVYGKATNGAHPEEDMIILKNLNHEGFRLSEERLHLDKKHITLVLDRLAKFHALSLVYQMDDPEGFNTLVSQIKFVSMGDMIRGLVSDEIFANILHRGVEPLKKDPKYQDRLSDLCANLDNAVDQWNKYILPSESLAVISLGDCYRNNVMFKYGSGDPVEVAFFDFQAVKVSSPAEDICSIIFRNVAPEVTNAHWDQLLRTYYGSLCSQLDGYRKKPSLEDVDLDVRRKGISGYYTSSIFIPIMMSHIGASDASGSDINWESMDNPQLKEVMRKFRTLDLGGSEATHLLAGIVKNMIDKNFIF